MNILKKSVLTTLAALAVVSTTARAETFPVLWDTAGTPAGVIKKSAGTAATLPVSPKSAAYLNFFVSGYGYRASQVSKARLVVYLPTVTKAGNLKFAVGTSLAPERFSPATFTLPSVPTGSFSSPSVDPSVKKDFIIVDVTAQVRAWLTNGPNSEFGIVITSDGSAACTIAAKEGPASGYPAALEVDFGAALDSNGNTIFNSGNVGIGTTAPLARLNVVQSGAGTSILIGDGAANKTNVIIGTSADTNGYSSIQATKTQNSAFGDLILNGGGGNIGIGTTTPTQAKLVVAGSSQGSSGYTTEAYVNADGAFNSSFANDNAQAGIYATSLIRSDVGYIVSSDARTKTVLNVSDSAADLAALKQIQITDYQFKDTVSRGLKTHKKVIAQQIEPFCPQAIVKSTDVVPDIYKAASAKDGWVELNTDLKKGERVRLIADKTTGIYEVLEVRDGAFRTAFLPEGEKVFVYGREVNDFRTVDYDAIAMLNVSATQELAKQLAAKEATIAALEAKLAAFGDKLAALENATPVRTARSEAPAPQPATVEVK